MRKVLKDSVQHKIKLMKKHCNCREALVAILILIFPMALMAQGTKELASNKLFYYGEGKHYAYFKKGTTVQLNDQDKVTRGVLAKNTILYMCSNCPADHAHYAKGTEATFSGGFVRSGTLNETLVLYITERRHAYFRSGYEVEFYPGGWVKSGMLHSTEHLYYNKDKTAVFMEGQEVSFNEEGYIQSGTLAQSVSLPTPNGHESFEAGTYVEFRNGKAMQ